MHFLLSNMSVVYVLTTPILENGGNDASVEQNIESSKELWDSLEVKYMAKDASSKKFLVTNFINYKMTRPVLEQYTKLLKILRRFTQHKMNMDESIQELTLVELDRNIKKALRVQDNDKLNGNNVIGPPVGNIVEHNNSSRDCKWVNVNDKANGSGTKGLVDGSFNSLKGHNDDVAWWVDSGATVHVCKDRCWFKTYKSLNDGSILHIGNESTTLVHRRGCVDLSTVVRLLDLKLKTLGERGIECIFVGNAKHSKAFRIYVIDPNDSVSINSIIESMDAIFDENRFFSVPRPSLGILNGSKDTGGLVVHEEVTDEDDPKTFDEAIKSQDVAFWKEVINDEMDSIIGNNTCMLVDLPPGCKPLGCKCILKRKLKVDGTIEKFKTTFLNGKLDEELYMNQPQGFIMPDNENKVKTEQGVFHPRKYPQLVNSISESLKFEPSV
ncbi:zinc finger, CCHC-type containing protein, partial [Tanacetum coccineum]